MAYPRAVSWGPLFNVSISDLLLLDKHSKIIMYAYTSPSISEPTFPELTTKVCTCVIYCRCARSVPNSLIIDVPKTKAGLLHPRSKEKKENLTICTSTIY